jgi:hypothetical protein
MKSRQASGNTIPNPSGKVLTRGILQAVDFVKIIVVQLLPYRLERGSDIRVVDIPTGLGIYFTANRNLAFERMPVQPRALMPRGNARQKVSRLKRYFFHQFDHHFAEILALY